MNRYFIILFACFSISIGFIVAGWREIGALEDQLTELKKKSFSDFEGVDVKNSCYVNSVLFQEALKTKEKLEGISVSPKILIMQRAQIIQHAAVCFKYEGVWRLFDSNTGTHCLYSINPNEEPDPLFLAQKLNPDYDSARWLK